MAGYTVTGVNASDRKIEASKSSPARSGSQFALLEREEGKVSAGQDNGRGAGTLGREDRCGRGETLRAAWQP
jgi:hypothetical protein